MEDVVNLKEAIQRRGPYVVWELLSEDEQKQATAALWSNADRDSRSALEVALAKELKFRPQSVRHLPVERITGRLRRMADSLPEAVLFQFLFHLHMDERRPLMVELLDALELPHDNGVLELPEDFGELDPDRLAKAAEALIKAHGRPAVVYLSTLMVADKEFWKGLGSVLEGFSEDGNEKS